MIAVLNKCRCNVCSYVGRGCYNLYIIIICFYRIANSGMLKDDDEDDDRDIDWSFAMDKKSKYIISD